VFDMIYFPIAWLLEYLIKVTLFPESRLVT